MTGLFFRALLAFLALPGMVAFVVPLLLITPGAARVWVEPWGALPLGLGLIVLALTVREFYVAGKGTLAPWSPPKHLVTAGLYRYSRNPMYVSVLLIVLGWAIPFDVPGLYWYAIGVGISFHLRVVLGEEPWLAQTHGAIWNDYTRRVRRWL